MSSLPRQELAAWLRLACTPHIGNDAARRLLAAFGLPQDVFAQSREALLNVVTPRQAAALVAQAVDIEAQLQTTLAWLAQDGAHHVLTLADAAYPRELLNIEDPPLVLYAIGDISAGWPPAISIVGSRNPTPQGLENARQFAMAFSQDGHTVVSGMALGIDGAAHEGALEGAPPGVMATIAVVGTGLDRVYPARHRALAHRIAQRGVMLSEYQLGTPPLAENFPRRNRIIAALGKGTLVVEAALKSGSLITARQASEQGKDVFAIPGSIHSAQARGCHWLIRQGAKLVETAQDVLEELQPLGGAKPIARAHPEEPSVPEDSLLAALGFDPVGLDALVARTGVAAAQLQARLFELELDGQAARLPGGMFQRIAVS